MYTVMSFQATLSMILIIMFIMRRKGGYEQYIGKAQFWSASKILLGVTLLWTYHLFAFFITYWYGRLEVEQNIIKYLFVSSYLWIFLANMLFSFVVPFLLLIWNPLRRSDWGAPLAGCFALLGAFLFNIRTFVAAFNTGNLYEIGLSRVPPPVFPGIADILMVVGMISLAALVYLLGAKILPLVSIWETKEGAQYQKMDTLFKGHYLVLAKPE
jgi:Ni/Fe-hydrogenase subunit HybB-like protein